MDVAAHYGGVATYDQLDAVWPWSRVLAWHARITEHKFQAVLPAYTAIADFRNANRGKNTKAVSMLDVMPSFYKPAGLDDLAESTAGNGNKWTPAVVASFTLLLKRGKASNALLNTLHIADLRASGYQG